MEAIRTSESVLSGFFKNIQIIPESWRSSPYLKIECLRRSFIIKNKFVVRSFVFLAFWMDSFSHSFTSLNIVLEDTAFNNESSIYGFNVNLTNIDRDGNIKTLVDGSEAVGLYADLRNVTVQESGIDTRGYAFSAFFEIYQI